MPWREVCSMDERMRLMAALAAEEESVTELCAVRHQPQDGVQVVGALR